jgi:ubiquinol-cytochrome c reductase cytochrome c subunit
MKTLTVIAVLLTGAVAFAQPPAAANIESGKKQFLRAGCWECHGYAGQGGRDGARLADTALTTAQLTRYVRRPAGAMPAYIDKVMTDQELADIWTYLKSMPAPKAAKDIPLLNDLKGQ